MPERRAIPSRDLFKFAGWDEPGLLDREVARRTVRTGSLLTAAAAVVFAAIYALADSSLMAIPTLALSAALVAIAFAPFRSAHAQLAAATTAGLLLLGSQVFLLGDVNTGVTVWLFVPSVAAMIRGARWIAAAAAAFAMVVLGIVTLASRFGWPIIGSERLPQADAVMILSVLGSLVVLGAIARISVGARRQLMNEVAERNAALADALAEAEAARSVAIEASEAKDRFFANLTHEIRTPLNGIAGTAELLGHTELDDDQRPLVGALGASTANLVLLVNAMLDHARLRAGHVGAEPVPVEVRRAAANLEQLFRAQAIDKGLDFAVTVDEAMPAWIEVDAIKVRQILGNLVANAIKFTATGSVTVTVDQAPPDPTHASPGLVVRVADTGVGIAPDKAASIFEPFVQADASISRTYGGTGLGLAIARQLTDVLGGTLTVSSRPGDGSVFTLAVPFRAVDAPPAPAQDQDTPGLPASGVRVLLAEDNEINRIVMVRILRRLDAVVHVVADGAEAVEAAATERFHVILMDLQMPRLDGIEAARIIRNHERSRGLAAIPIIAMTGNDHEDYGDACTAAGMDGFLMKPVGLVELRAVLDRLAAAGLSRP